MKFNFDQIGVVHSCFKEKFGIPRQPGLATESRAVIEILHPYNREEAFRGIEQFSHLWICFIFHACLRDKWKATVRPPRLGGNKRIGVFSTRSNYRPNPLGLSVVKLHAMRWENKKLFLDVHGGDFLEGTPVVDIKPYLVYADAVTDAESGFASQAQIYDIDIEFSDTARQQCETRLEKIPNIFEFINQVLHNDPRPAYYGSRNSQRTFGLKLYDFDLQWQVTNNRITILELKQC